MNDLEWLARNVHEWPKTDSYAVVWHEKGRVRVLWDCGTQNGESFTREQWQAERARLQKLEPRPEEQTMTKKEWRGPEDGLPPVGTKCEVRTGYATEPYSYEECDIIAHFMGTSKMCAAYTTVNHDGSVMVGQGTIIAFRPLRTEEDRAVEDMINIIAEVFNKSGDEWAANEDIAKAIYAAGYRKQEPSE